MQTDNLFERVQKLRSGLIGRATGGSNFNDLEYKDIRKDILGTPRLQSSVPSCVRKCYDLSDFWGFIKNLFGTYEERRVYLRQEFAPLLERLEKENHRTPLEANAGLVLQKAGAESINDAWARALERQSNDPEGAITAARTLLESVCKSILDASGIEYEDGIDMPKLYSLTARQLNLAPSGHGYEILKRILGGCTVVVENLGALRNKIGDAHGKGIRKFKPSGRHATLAVNLAGAMSMFLVETWQHQHDS